MDVLAQYGFVVYVPHTTGTYTTSINTRLQNQRQASTAVQLVAIGCSIRYRFKHMPTLAASDRIDIYTVNEVHRINIGGNSGDICTYT